MEIKDATFMLKLIQKYKEYAHQIDGWTTNYDREQFLKNIRENCYKAKLIINREMGFINTNKINGSDQK